MAKIFRYSEKDHDGKKFRPQSRHYNDLIDRVRDYIKTTNKTIVRKEELAEIFKAKPHEIEQCFQKLNLEGLLSQAEKINPHDYSRHTGDSCWAADIYRILNNKKQEDVEGKLILTSVNDVKKLNDNIVRVFIARQPLKNMDKLGWKWASKLAPSYNLLKDFKSNNISWNDYYKRYMQEVIYNPTCKGALDVIYNHLKAGENIVLICYCSDADRCHRGILGKYYEDLGVEIINFNDEMRYSDKFYSIAENIYNDNQINKILEESFSKNMVELSWLIQNYATADKKVNFTNSQLKIIIDEIYNIQLHSYYSNVSIKFANILIKFYALPVELREKLESIIVMNNLNKD